MMTELNIVVMLFWSNVELPTLIFERSPEPPRGPQGPRGADIVFMLAPTRPYWSFCWCSAAKWVR